ncbi:E3 ubiquitin-protein ligase rlim [Thalictrum thalictroides]|uniref:E3 ubiquitin-protein ligase rlim n=1 Tax=Thalictrum thalictroides TaxID=46969 RepID=A0A7J6V274_THATH|nr:E3 ubiquitin-protein ligase rlim [Thalictrum thalictroides]
MTSASELFHNRRLRIGRNNDTNELGFGSSSSSSLDRNFPLPLPLHHPHHNHHNRRRSRRHNQRRGEFTEDCEPIRRSSSHSRHICYRENEPIRLDHGVSQFSAGNSSNSEISSGRVNRLQFSRSDQLPGDVLLARERLVERLRGVSFSANRPSSRIIPGVPGDEITYNDDFRLVDAWDWEIETSADYLAGNASYSDTRSSFPSFSTKRPRGLKQEEVDCLNREVFTIKAIDDALLIEVGLECSICLDKFHEGDDLIRLPCEHKFHFKCLYPWVRTCGDCPNCRAGVIIGNPPDR